MADHRGGVRHDVGLGHPALGVDVRRQRAEVGGVAFAPDGHEQSDGQRSDRVDRRAAQRGEGFQLRRHRAEREVDERVAGAVPPVRQRAGAGPSCGRNLRICGGPGSAGFSSSGGNSVKCAEPAPLGAFSPNSERSGFSARIAASMTRYAIDDCEMLTETTGQAEVCAGQPAGELARPRT